MRIRAASRHSARRARRICKWRPAGSLSKSGAAYRTAARGAPLGIRQPAIRGMPTYMRGRPPRAPHKQVASRGVPFQIRRRVPRHRTRSPASVIFLRTNTKPDNQPGEECPPTCTGARYAHHTSKWRPRGVPYKIRRRVPRHHTWSPARVIFLSTNSETGKPAGRRALTYMHGCPPCVPHRQMAPLGVPYQTPRGSLPNPQIL